QVADDVRDGVAADPVLASDDAADRLEQEVGGRRLQDDAPRAELERLDELDVLDRHREDEDARRVRGSAQLPKRVEAARAGHREVEEEHVRPELAGETHGVGPVRGLAHHREASLVVEQTAQAIAEDWMVVRDHDPDRLALARSHRASCGRTISSRAPLPGEVTILSSPPSACTRSLMT